MTRATSSRRTGRAAIGYRVLAGMAVAGGDPLGARESWPGAVEEFCGLVERSGWRPAVLGAGPDARPLWQERGMRCIGIGDEVIVDTNAFTLHGRAMRNVRQAVHRTERAGLVTEVILRAPAGSRPRRPAPQNPPANGSARPAANTGSR